MICWSALVCTLSGDEAATEITLGLNPSTVTSVAASVSENVQTSANQLSQGSPARSLGFHERVK